MNKIETERLLLREWIENDLEAFSLINQDPKVMEFLPGSLTRDESVEFIRRIQQQFKTHGFGLWAVTVKDTGEMIGYVGLYIPGFKAHFTPCVEIGWRLASGHWGKGYATEAARAVLEVAFEKYGLEEVISFTVPANVRSINIMKKIGMTHDEKDDFIHPVLPTDHRLSKHVLYRIKKSK